MEKEENIIEIKKDIIFLKKKGEKERRKEK